MPDSGGDIYSPNKQSLNTANQGLDALLAQSQGQSGSLAQLPQQVQGLTSNFLNNPYQQQAQTGANAAGQYGTGTVVPQMQQGAAALQGVGQQNAAYVPQALQTGFDPQNALYNRNFQQTLDQQSAINAMSGISGTPYGAGVTGQRAQDFNLDWQNQALQRQAQGAQTAGALTGAANTGFTGGANLGVGAQQEQVSASGLPSSTYQQNIMDALKALTGGTAAVGGAADVTNQGINQILQYLGYGTQATGQQAQASNAAWSGIGQGVGGLASLAFL